MPHLAARHRLQPVHFSWISFGLFFGLDAHPRKIPPRFPAHKWKTIFLLTASRDAFFPLFPLNFPESLGIAIFSFSVHKTLLLSQTFLR
jgi:hypothetical protein